MASSFFFWISDNFVVLKLFLGFESAALSVDSVWKWKENENHWIKRIDITENSFDIEATEDYE